MSSLITKGIKVSVQAEYDHLGSKPSQYRYIHAYHVRIENLSGKKVQLLTRYWEITASNGVMRTVEGEGVIGQQPVLDPFDIHEYSSWCPLPTPMGKMSGRYGMMEVDTEITFDVAVPEFKLIADFVNN